MLVMCTEGFQGRTHLALDYNAGEGGVEESLEDPIGNCGDLRPHVARVQHEAHHRVHSGDRADGELVLADLTGAERFSTN
jgi:hypothetical protein